MAPESVTPEELLFFEPMPALLPLYTALRERLATRYPALALRVAKTQISFRNRYGFAAVSLCRRRLPDRPRGSMLVTFGLSHRVESPRILCAVEPYPGRWTHHVPVSDPRELDGTLLAWLDEAYHFSMVK